MRDAFGSVQSVLVLGGGSEIALATVKRLVADRTKTVILAARDPASLDPTRAELRGLGADSVETVRFDARETRTHPEVIDQVFDRPDDIDLVLVAFGVLGDQHEFLDDPEAAADAIQVNFTGAASALLAVAQHMRRQGHGQIVVLSSVAAERARRSNFVYGASKAGLDAFAQGLGDELVGSGIDVVVIRPGMVRTRMTAGMDDVPFVTTTDAVADDIVEAVRRRAHTVWSPPILRYVMAILRHLPRRVFRRLDI